MNTRTFTLGEVLSVTHDRLLVPIGRLYEILNYLTADSLYTHQLPRASRECRPYILHVYPWLARIDASGVGSDNWRGWLAQQVATYGDAFALEPMPDGVHEYREPITELQEMAGDKPIIVIAPKEL